MADRPKIIPHPPTAGERMVDGALLGILLVIVALIVFAVVGLSMLGMAK